MPFHSLDAYAQSRIKWHQESCPIARVTDFFLFIEQHAFFLMLIKLVSTLALQNPDAISSDLQVAVLGQNSVCPSQLKDAFHDGIKGLKMPVEYADYADDVHSYMAMVLDEPVPVLGKTIPRPPALSGTFPRHVPSSATPAAPPSASSSASSSSKKRSSTKALEFDGMD